MVNSCIIGIGSTIRKCQFWSLRSLHGVAMTLPADIRLFSKNNYGNIFFSCINYKISNGYDSILVLCVKKLPQSFFETLYLNKFQVVRQVLHAMMCRTTWSLCVYETSRLLLFSPFRNSILKRKKSLENKGTQNAKRYSKNLKMYRMKPGNLSTTGFDLQKSIYLWFTSEKNLDQMHCYLARMLNAVCCISLAEFRYKCSTVSKFVTQNVLEAWQHFDVCREITW